jgi:GH24 family phage-related lysozyme (muramidase)
MREVVRDSFYGFTRDLEGACTWPYLDVLGIPTTGYGNAFFSAAAFCAQPWLKPDGSFASRDEMLAEYSGLLNLVGKRNARGVLWTDCGGGIFQQLTRLRLSLDAVGRLVASELARFDAAMAHRYEDYADWPACAQLAVLSLAWACGASYDFPKMDGHLATGDFAMAATEIEMTKASNPGNNLTARNKSNETLMLNAARVRDFHLDPDTLNWTSLVGVSEAKTLPDLGAIVEEFNEPPNTASEPTIAPRPLPEEVTGSGGIIHPWLFGDPPPDDAA